MIDIKKPVLIHEGWKNTGLYTSGLPTVERAHTLSAGWKILVAVKEALYHKHPSTPQQEGKWQRKGEKHKPVAWFAWGETERKHGLTKQPELPSLV